MTLSDPPDSPCCGIDTDKAPEAPAAMAKFHTALNVRNLAASVDFYRLLFGCEAAKRRPDYAKFELSEPPLVLSLIPGRPSAGSGAVGGGAGVGNVNHFGLRVTTAETLVEIQRRLELGGIRTQREDGVECCYARQTKFWVADPDKVLWEIYILHEDTDEHGTAEVPHPDQLLDHSPTATPASNSDSETSPPAPSRIIWRHRIGEPIPVKLSSQDNSVHEAELEGTANLPPTTLSLPHLLREILRVLRPGASIRLHGLTSDHPLTEPLPPLPGPASVVKHVPSHRELVLALTEAGFIQPTLETLSATAHFTVGGIALREIILTAAKPGHRSAATPHTAIYLGPHAAVTGDSGRIFPAGEPVAVNIHDRQILSGGPFKADFLLL